MRRSFLVVLLGAFILSACGGAPPPADEGDVAPDLAVVDPASAFEPVGDFAPGRFSILYVPVELRGPDGAALHPAVPRADRAALIEHDRRFIFDLRDSPLAGRGGKVNLLLARAPLVATLDAARMEKLAAGAKSSDVVDVWARHAWVEDMVAAHGDWFGAEPVVVYQVPHRLRDQATWFRFDRVAGFAEAAMSTWDAKDWGALASFLERTAKEDRHPVTLERLLDRVLTITGAEAAVDAVFPKLKVPLVWHAVGAGQPGLSLKTGSIGVPRSSVILFHELGHAGECRASDGYSEASMSTWMQDNPREAAVIDFLGRTVTLADVVRAAERFVPDVPMLGDAVRAQVTEALAKWVDGGDGVNVAAVLLRNTVSRRAVGKVLGEPNVLPDDPAIIDDVWGKVPGFRQKLRDEKSQAAAQPGDVRIVRGGLYVQDRAFARLQVFQDGDWRNTYMADSSNPKAPIGPVLEDCLARWARRIDRQAGHGPTQR